jgi:2-keto-3-deoxy-L-rhamnonate aldolase RhmA
MTGIRGNMTAEVERTIEHLAARLGMAGRAFGMPARLDQVARFRALGATFLYYPVEWLIERAMQELQRETGR